MAYSESILATDLDGTLIPLPDQAANPGDLKLIAQAVENRQLHLAFVTGRHLESVLQAIGQFQLPTPDWILCDVGASVYRRQSDDQFLAVADYQEHLAQIASTWSHDRLKEYVQSAPELTLQEPEKQSPFKLSFYTDAQKLEECYQRICEQLANEAVPWSIVHSVDPFTGDGLIDFLPKNVNKAYALQWWATHQQIPVEQLIFAGDSGNDIAALEYGYRAIVVGNASPQVANRAFWTHQDRGTPERLFVASHPATSGVVEGLRWYGALPALDEDRELPLGAIPVSSHLSRVSVWAPRAKHASVTYQEPGQPPRQIDADRLSEAPGVYQAMVPAGPGTDYQWKLDGAQGLPDPRSRWQPHGVHQSSQVISLTYPWMDQQWTGRKKQDLVVYELHIGTFTPEGTYDAALRYLDELLELGITAIELMPLAQCPGRWNWGYDGVQLFAPNRNYGTPAQLCRFIDTCHQKGLAVLLDVVYNHLGPEGNYLSQYGPYFTNRHQTPWGDALNYDGPDSQPVRQMVFDNALYWLEQFHFDGLRLDAIHFMFDNSDNTIQQEICDAVRDFERSSGRRIHLIGEANIYDGQLIDPQRDNAYCAIWADCLMHSVYSHGIPELNLTNRVYTGAKDIAEALQHGFLYTGPELARTVREPDEESDRNTVTSLVMALQTHDSVGNHPHGKRLGHLVDHDFQTSAVALFLLYPAIPMLFMGEEFAADSPFRFFADFLDPGLRKAVDRGRRREYPNHQWKGALRPSDPDSFYTSKLDRTGGNPDVRAWYKALLKLRREGQNSGWLSTSQLSVTFDTSPHQFQLNYRFGDRQIQIVSQLISPGLSSPPAIMTADDFPQSRVLLDSWAVVKNRTGASRCLILESTG